MILSLKIFSFSILHSPFLTCLYSGFVRVLFHNIVTEAVVGGGGETLEWDELPAIATALLCGSMYI